MSARLESDRRSVVFRRQYQRIEVIIPTTTAGTGRVLVTGGAGFIGCAISQVLAPSAPDFVVLDNLHPQVHATGQRPAALHDAARLVRGDVTDPAAWAGLFDEYRPEIIVHLAAETGTGQSLSEAGRHAAVNVLGTALMVDALVRAEHRPRHILLTSSRAVYGEGAWRRADGTLFHPGQRTHAQLAARQWDFQSATPVPSFAGSTQPMPTSVYGATKLCQEHTLAAWCLAFAVPLSVLRLQNVYGPGQSLTNSYTGIVALFSRLASAHRPIPLYEDGRTTRDFVHISDVASAIAAALAAPPAVAATYDIGSGRAHTIGELADVIARHHGAPEPEITGQFRDGDVRHATCRVDAAAHALGWSPRVALPDGLAELQGWLADELGGKVNV